MAFSIRDVPGTERNGFGTDFVERNGFTRGPERILWSGTDLHMDRNGLARICLLILGPMGPMGPYGALGPGRDPGPGPKLRSLVPAGSQQLGPGTRVPAGTPSIP